MRTGNSSLFPPSILLLWGLCAGCGVPSVSTSGGPPASPFSASDGSVPEAGRFDALRDAPATAAAAPPSTAKCTPGLQRGLALPCGCGAECASGFCADGVCCNLPCTDACTSCKLPGRMGACIAVGIGAPDPHGVCTRQAPETCGRTGLCGLSGCAKYQPGSPCRAPSCSGGSLVYPYCHTDGTCAVGTAINCSPSTCAGGACTLKCASDAECAAPHACVKGSCGLRGPGQPCEVAGQCQSGFCADGVCCDAACDGSCVSCALTSALGQCTPLAAGAMDPRGACQDQGAASCGTNGRCDGAGACQKYAPGTVCKAGRCDPATDRWSPEAVCGAGGCETAIARACAPFRCEADGSRCAGGCKDNADCQSPATCQAGSCGKKTLGSLCARGDDCASGFCAQGVCCNTACATGCFACNLAGSTGTCAALADGAAAPSGACAAEGPTSCGNDGTCDGAGGCSKYGPATICAPPSCARGTKTASSFCNGLGACVAGSKIACAPYVCNTAGTDCFSSCQGTGAAPECLAPNLCNDQRCGRAGKGQVCGATADCAAGLTCVQGICCDRACSGPCLTCKSVPGTCTPRPAGTATNGCKVDAAKPCGQTGKCDGEGACARAAPTTVCAPAACTNDRSGKQAALCDGAGACRLALPLACGSNRCAAGKCSPCTADADCLDSKACDPTTGTCGSGKANGASCMAAGECASAACVDGRCCESSACGACQRCGTDGRCAPVTGAPDPDSCPDESAAQPCGRRGCDATGACSWVAMGTVIAGPTCKDPATATATTCNGSGGSNVTDTSCQAGYRCASGICPSSCTTDGQCLPPSSCLIPGGGGTGACGKKPLGADCTGNDWCASGFCASGICCNEACSGSCRACSAAGQCTPVAPGTSCGADSCDSSNLNQPRCDGAGACAVVTTNCADTGQVCAAGLCVAAPDAGSD